MPILKAIAGHGGTAGIRRYLERGNRALARDVMNLPMEEWVGEAPGEHSIFVDWDVEMDRTREAYGTSTPWRGLDARTFEHFVISPDPADGIDLDALRRLSRAWTERQFKDFEVAIVYHDDNERGIPHAHVVVNNANLKTGYRCHISNPEALNQELQDMAREMGLSGLSNVMPKRGGKERESEPRSRQAVYFGRAEREIMRSGGYSWVGDIRARVALAKNTSRTEGKFRTALAKLGISVEDNSEKARRDDWIFALADDPTKRVSGERLGFTYGKQMLLNRFQRQGAYIPEARTASQIRQRAASAVALNDLADLSRLSAVLETCAKFNVRSLGDFDRRLSTLQRRGSESSEGYRRLVEARSYAMEKGLMQRDGGTSAAATRMRGNQGSGQRIREQEVERARARERSGR